MSRPPERPSAPAAEQFQARPMGTASEDESRRGRAENELQHLAILATYLQPPALLVDCQHGPRFEAAAEMCDARLGSNTG